jgi:malonate decarboxylase beta subunit
MSVAIPNRPLSWFEASARQRVAALVDSGSFVEFIGPERRETSPHLPIFDLPAQFDDGMIVGRAGLGGRAVLVAA